MNCVLVHRIRGREWSLTLDVVLDGSRSFWLWSFTCSLLLHPHPYKPSSAVTLLFQSVCHVKLYVVHVNAPKSWNEIQYKRCSCYRHIRAQTRCTRTMGQVAGAAFMHVCTIRLAFTTLCVSKNYRCRSDSVIHGWRAALWLCFGLVS